MNRRASLATFALAALLAACGVSTSGPAPAPGPAPRPVPAAPSGANAAGAFPGFDTGIYPGDDALRAWRRSSPYVWVGYYLPAPCHRDASWSGKRERLIGMGWGTAVIYLGQQDWAAAPGRVPAARDTATRTDSTANAQPSAPPAPPACSASNLSAARGTTEAADAAAKTAAEGFPSGTLVYLDVERVTAVSPALLEYVRGWIDGMLADGRFIPGIYCHRLNADALRDAARAVYAARGRAGEPPFWVTSSGGFSLEQAPRGVGLDYASIWQGRLDVAETWGGVTLTIDANVADTRSPSGQR
ncbi:MAG: glycoside hydrolase domain-containing protein [Longimicrobiaceae bacterium]